MTIDTGPYLSIAHNLNANGRPDSNFNFLGNFEQLPGPPNFIPPGVSGLIALFQPVIGDPVVSAKLLLFLCLLAAQLSAVHLLKDLTGSLPYALGASLLLTWNENIVVFASMILSELPFIACLLAATLAASKVLRGTSGRWMRFLILPAASAALCLIRYIGIFFPLAFAVTYVLLALHQGNPSRTRRLLYALSYLIGSLTPLGLWILVAGTASPGFFPSRPPSHIGLLQAVQDATGYIVAWFGIWAVFTGLAGILSRILRRTPHMGAAPVHTEIFLASATLAYLICLIWIRTSKALYPLDELGSRYMAPVWSLLFLLAAVLFHRWIWSPGRELIRASSIVVALGALGLAHTQIAEFRLPPPFPTKTTTYRTILERAGNADVVLCSFGQTLMIHRPDLRVIGIPSQLDFIYELDLPKLVDQFDIDWLVLFEQPGKRQMYPPWFGAWFSQPPEGVRILAAERFRDGVIYRLGESP